MPVYPQKAREMCVAPVGQCVGDGGDLVVHPQKAREMYVAPVGQCVGDLVVHPQKAREMCEEWGV